MADQQATAVQPKRTLSEAEFNALRDKVLASAPPNLSEDQFNNWIAPALDGAIAEAEAQPAQPDGSAVSRFVSNAADVLNPAALVRGVWGAVRDPVGTATAVGYQQGAQATQAGEEFMRGNLSEAAGHGTAAMLPLVGPAAAEAGEQIAAGDVAGGMGRGVGLLAPMGAPSAIRSAVGAARTVAPEGVRAAATNALERGAAGRVADVMSPKVGANKVRFGNMAEEVAPSLAKNPETAGGWSRDALHAKVSDGLTQAERMLDDATNARLSARTFTTKPLVDALLERRARLTAESVEGSRPIPSLVGSGGKPTPAGPVRDITSGRMKPTLDKQGRPIGADVVPGPNAARVAQIDQAIAEIRQLGPVARYESIRRIREAYDGPAKAVYAPSVTADFLKAQGGKLGAADVTGTLREHLAKWDPQTAQVNAQYSLFRKANDVLDAAAEVERTRPKVGRLILARMTGALGGAQTAGVGGAIAGYAFAPAMEAALSSGWTTQLKTAQMMTKLATAIRKGDVGSVTSLSMQLKRLGAQVGTLTGNATSPSGLQTQTTGPTR